MKIEWLNGSFYLEEEEYGVMIDTPDGVASRLHSDQIQHLQWIILTGGRVASFGGLFPVLERVGRERAYPLHLWAPYGDECPALIAESYQKGVANPCPVVMEGDFPGASFSAGPFQLQTWKLEKTSGVTVRIKTREQTILWVPEGWSIPFLKKQAQDLDLAVVQTHPHDPLLQELFRVMPTVKTLWLVDAQGGFLERGNA